MATLARKKPLTRKKKTPVVKTRPVGPTAADRVFDGELPEGGEYLRDGIYLVHYRDAPKNEIAFPPVDTKGVPPETYYAFDESTKRVEFMYSVDAFGVGIAWDTDRDARYFARLGRNKYGERLKLQCPRYVEYTYDCSNALKAGEHWSHSHPNYSGSLRHRKGGYPDRATPSVPATRKKPSEAASGGILTPSTRPALPRKNARTGTLPTKPTAPLRRKAIKREDESELLTAKGLDKSKLDQAAASMVDDFDKAFAKSTPLKRKAPLKRKRG